MRWEQLLWLLPLVGCLQEPLSAETQTVGDYEYTRPHFFTFLTRIPGDFWDYGKDTFQEKNLPWFLAVGGSTALFIWKDQYIVDQAHALGSRWHIDPTDHQKTVVSIPLPISSFDFGVPYNLGSALYFIGDGWLDVGLSAGFFSYGLAGDDNRALQTSTEILESILASGTIVQIVKHVTGRQDPYTSTQSGGKWQFFPDQVQYAEHVPEYDAFPSGHLAAAVAVYTVISENYSEYRFITPLGYTLLTLVSFQMLNNGVHWASDYPLAIALGYGFGRIAVAKGRQARQKGESSKADFHIFPGPVGDGVGLQIHWRWG
jgi:membrane-associated phospholipid phosphatase